MRRHDNHAHHRAAPLTCFAILVCLCAVAASHGAAAREAGGNDGDLGTDRDAFTPSTHTVAPGTVLSEGSYVFIDNPVGLPTNNYPEL